MYRAEVPTIIGLDHKEELYFYIAPFLFEAEHQNNINLHTFRHTYAHNMLNKGVPKEVLQTLLGHRSIKTTEIYANWVRKEELEKWIT